MSPVPNAARFPGQSALFTRWLRLACNGCATVAIVLLAGCGSTEPSETAQSADAGVEQDGGPSELPPGWDDEVALSLAVDENPDPHIVEVTLDAAPATVHFKEGVATDVWAYNGTIPGPLIRAKVGDRVIVHFTNHLPEETTVHWHGVRVPSDMDGTLMVQDPVWPGEDFTYDYIVPDAGMFWYHPHVRSNEQVGMGLYGPMIIDDPMGVDGEEPPLGRELPLVFDDVRLEDDGQLAPLDDHGALGSFFGREGETLLVNGRQLPTIDAQPGVPLRLRIVNAAPARYFELGLEGHTFTRIGGDGGLIPHPVTSETLLVVPGERADVIFTPKGPEGDVLTLRWLPYERGYCASCRDPEDLMRIHLVKDPGWEKPPLPSTLRVIDALDMTGASEQLIQLTTGAVGGMPTMGINGHTFEETVPIEAMVFDRQIWRVENTTEADHPFHLHGFSFQVIDFDGVAPSQLEWKDTLNIPAKKTARLALAFDDRSGMWMFHCHILDHAALGMMGMLDLMP